MEVSDPLRVLLSVCVGNRHGGFRSSYCQCMLEIDMGVSDPLTVSVCWK